jgi:hypothetical protein
MHVITDPSHLSHQQQELILAAAANRGMLQIANRSDTHGRAVCTRGEVFSDANDREVSQRYQQELKTLIQVLLVRQAQAKDFFELTNFGWRISRKVQALATTENA